MHYKNVKSNLWTWVRFPQYPQVKNITFIYKGTYLSNSDDTVKAEIYNVSEYVFNN